MLKCNDIAIKSSGLHIDRENNKDRLSVAHLGVMSKKPIFIFFSYKFDLFATFIYENIWGVKNPSNLKVPNDPREWKERNLNPRYKKRFRIISIDVLYHGQRRIKKLVLRKCRPVNLDGLSGLNTNQKINRNGETPLLASLSKATFE
jgi:hypothetical protein